jgi:hypothetical protein
MVWAGSPRGSEYETGAHASKYLETGAGSNFADRFQNQAAPALEKAEGRRPEHLSIVVGKEQ